MHPEPAAGEDGLAFSYDFALTRVHCSCPFRCTLSPVPEDPLHHDSTGERARAGAVAGGSLGTSLAMWEPQVVLLAERLRVIRYDHRGHGASPVPPGPYEIEDLGRDVLALMDRLGVERASLGGVSLGGMVAMWLGANAPDRVERLVPLLHVRAHAAGVRVGGASGQGALRGIDRGRRGRGGGALAHAAFADAHAETQTWLRAMLVGNDPVGYAECCGVIERMDLRDALPSIAAPTLVVSGADDQAAPLDHQRLLADAIPSAHLETLTPAAHIASVEQAAEVTRLILDHVV